MASNSRPTSSICSALSRVRGLSIMVGIWVLAWGSKGDLDGSFGGIDARADDLALAAGHLARTEVADLARAQLSDAGVADAHPAAEGERRAGLLAGDEDWLRALAARLDVALEELDRAALADLSVALADDGLEALHVQAIAVAGLVPVLAHRVEQVARSREERLALTPVGAQVVEVLGPDPAVLAGHLLVQAHAGIARRHLAQLVAEDDVVGRARGVQVDDVVQPAAAIEVAQHAHDRRDAAARAHEQQLVRRRIGELERSLDVAEPHDRPRLRLAHEPRRDGALLDELGRDADQPVGPAGVRRERIGPPMVDSIDHESDAHVLPGLVTRPFPARLDEDRRRVVGLALDALDAPAQLLRGPQRVDELEVVVRQQRREQRPHRVERTALQRRNLGSGAALSHSSFATSGTRRRGR